MKFVSFIVTGVLFHDLLHMSDDSKIMDIVVDKRSGDFEVFVTVDDGKPINEQNFRGYVPAYPIVTTWTPEGWDPDKQRSYHWDWRFTT
jgi:hypothetical protein